MKLEPVTVRVKAGPPCSALLGEREERAGTGLRAVMVKATAAEVPPPGVGVNTVIGAEPAVVRSLGGMLAVSWVALTKVVVRVPPFHCTTEAGTKPLPVTARVKAGPPCSALLGESDPSAGTGLRDVMMKATAAEVPPPGVVVYTVTGAEPAVVRSLAGMLAVSWVALTKVVVRVLPFHRTTEAGMKLEPVTVRVTGPPPCSALLGESDPSVGTGLRAVMVKATAAEVPPPGVMVYTVTRAKPAVVRSLAGMLAVS